MQWLNEPASWQRTGDVLRLSVDPGTDFWRATGYGYVHDNGHIYGELLPGDLDVSVRIRGRLASQYDQAGIMLRADEQTWLKTGMEFFEGRPRLSTVLTLGWSSWIVADLPAGADEVSLRVSRRGEAVEVRYTTGSGPAELAALVFLPPGRELLAGICCAAPEGGGFTVNFHDLRIAGRDWAAADGADWAEEPAAPAQDWVDEEPAASLPGWAAEPADSWPRPGPGSGPGDWGQAGRGDDAGGWPAPASDGADWGTAAAGGPASDWAEPTASDWAEPPASDWAEPTASTAAEDWEQLSQRVSTGREPEPPAALAPPAAGDVAGEQASLAGADDTTAAAPGSLAEDMTDPAMPAAGGEAGQNGQPPARGGGAARPRPGGKSGGRGKARARPAAAGPADAADEWISLLTADPADEPPDGGDSRPVDERPGGGDSRAADERPGGGDSRAADERPGGGDSRAADEPPGGGG
jgi:regulation of enolase protein 1 (concanavalin A-like superfamily)